MKTVPVVKKASKKQETNVLLKTLIAFKNGNLAVRMPVDESGLEGKIADTLNEILALNQRMVSEFDRISRAVGKDGKISQRASLGSATGAWADAASTPRCRLNAARALRSSCVSTLHRSGRSVK